MLIRRKNGLVQAVKIFSKTKSKTKCTLKKVKVWKSFALQYVLNAVEEACGAAKEVLGKFGDETNP